MTVRTHSIDAGILGFLLVIVAVIMFSLAGLLIVFESSNPKAYLELMAFGSALGFLGLKIP